MKENSILRGVWFTSYSSLSAPELSFAAQTRREEQFVSASPRNH
jgi:hypothetical protein